MRREKVMIAKSGGGEKFFQGGKSEAEWDMANLKMIIHGIWDFTGLQQGKHLKEVKVSTEVLSLFWVNQRATGRPCKTILFVS